MSYDTEANVLGALIRDNSLVDQFPFSPDDFTNEKLRGWYKGIVALVNAGEPADPITISEATDGDLAELATLVAESSIAPKNFPAYHRLLKRDAIVQQAHCVAEELRGCRTLEEVEAAVSELIALSHSQDSHESEQSGAVKRAINHLELIEGGLRPGLPTGLRALDDKLGGLHPGDLVVIGARSQHGKTALMMHMANSQTEPVGIVSGEQPDEQIAMRSIAMIGDVSLQRMRTGNLDSDDWQRIGEATKRMHDRKVHIFDKGGPSISEITAVARQWKFNKGIKVLFVDFLQLITGGQGDQHRLQIGDVARKLKVLAKQLNISVVALAQVVREVDKRPQGDNYLGRMPFTADLGDSKDIEDAADQIITLYRPSVYWPNNEQLRDRAYLNICKNRHGQPGVVRVSWKGEYVQFKDAAA